MAAGERPNPPIRPMGVGEILDHTFRVFRRAWKPLLGAGLISMIPSVVIGGLTQVEAMNFELGEGAMFEAIEAATRGDLGAIAGVVSALFGTIVLSTLLMPLFHGAMIHLSAEAILERRADLNVAFRAAMKRYLPMLGTYVLGFVLVIVAFPALILAGLVILAPITLIAGYLALFVFIAFAANAAMLEEVGGGVPAMRRSFQLARGHFWRLLGIGVVFALLGVVLGAIIGGALQLPATLLHEMVVKTAASAWVVALTSAVGPAVTTPFMLVGVTITYYDLRARKEGLDLEMAVRGGPDA